MKDNIFETRSVFPVLKLSKTIADRLVPIVKMYVCVCDMFGVIQRGGNLAQI